MSLVEELRITKERVEELLANYPNARNNDFYLQVMYMKRYLNIPMPWIDWSVLNENAGIMETIRRTRAKIQHEDKRYLPTDPSVSRRRKLKAEEFRKAINRV